MAALQKVERGDSESMMLYTGEDLDGYIGACFNEDGYVVEIEGLCGGKLRRDGRRCPGCRDRPGKRSIPDYA